MTSLIRPARPSGMPSRMPSRRRFLQASAACAAALLPARAGVAAGTAARRIVAIGADIAETIALLEGTGRLVGIDSASTRPEAVRKLPSVGFFRALSAEGVIALDPDLIVATDMLGPPVVVEQLAAAGIRIETLREPDTIAGVRAKITRIAAVIGRDREGRALADTVDAEFADLQRRLDGISQRPKVLFVVVMN